VALDGQSSFSSAWRSLDALGGDTGARWLRQPRCQARCLVNGGADIARQYFDAGALDEFRLHLVPVVLGAGTRLFDNLTLLLWDGADQASGRLVQKVVESDTAEAIKGCDS
jgi:dihydrofolate reductase